MMSIERSIQDVPIDSVVVRLQVRRQFDTESLETLADTIVDKGVLHPLLVFVENDQIVLLAGERRLRAAKIAGHQTIPVQFVEKPSDERDVISSQLVENLQREHLTPIEVAIAIDRLMELSGWSSTETSQKLGISVPSLSRSLALLDLPKSIQDEIHIGRISGSAGYALSQIGDRNRQEFLAREVAEGRLTRDKLTATAKSRTRKKSLRNRRKSAVKVVLDGERSLTFDSPEPTLETVIAWLSDLVELARRSAEDGSDLDSFIRSVRHSAVS
jgi:ParB family chromosome partitioning protein